MRRLFLSLVVALSFAAVRTRADEDPRKGPVRIEGRITNDDPKVKFNFGRPPEREMRAKPYDVQLMAGKHYTVTLNAVADAGKKPDFFNRFDPYLVVQDEGGKTIAHDDDSGGNLNARLTLRVPRDGTYRVFAAALSGVGNYVLSITEPNVLRQGFPAGKPEAGDLTKCETGWEIEWEITNADNGSGKKWSSPSSVLAIRSAKYMFKDAAGKMHWFTVLKNLEVGEIMVPYDHLTPVFLDVSEHAFNIVKAKKEYLGPNCVAPGEILDSIDPRMKNKVLKEVHDDGLRWMNSSERARRGEKMLLWAIFNGGNYRYIMEYGFADDGSITCRLGATAHNFFDRQKDGRDTHLHVACWRWDPELMEEGEGSDVGGASKNRVLLVRRVPSAPVPNGKFRVDIAPFNADEKGRATEGFADWKAEEFTTLRVESTERRNRSKDPRYTAYDLVPMRSGTVRQYPWKYAFANHDFWVTHRRGNQTKYSEVPLYAGYANPLEKQASTVWHNAASLHVPRGEDHGADGSSRKGAAITNWAGFMLRPVNLFDSTPLYDLANPAKKANPAGGGND
jgi:hypothetical protein